MRGRLLVLAELRSHSPSEMSDDAGRVRRRMSVSDLIRHNCTDNEQDTATERRSVSMQFISVVRNGADASQDGLDFFTTKLS